ncbi:MAG: hypothetical protein COC01_09825 [Bacteroidetes bacterium]|nr:MAG: hypothetical protein COC01_09825 [Bacteroidota bacterium]
MNKRILTLLIVTTVLLSNFNSTIAQDKDSIKKAKELFKERGNKDKLEGAIKKMQDMLGRDTIQAIAVLISHSYYLMGEYETDKKKKLATYEKGIKYGEIALGKIPAFAKARKANKKEADALPSLTKENIEALYWTAANIAKFAKFNSFAKKVSLKSRVRSLWDRVYELDPNYNYGGGYRFFGGYFALVPAITGDQDPVKAKEMFDKCIAVAPEYLDTKVLCAEAYCTHQQILDRELFKKLLKEVLEADINAYPEIKVENNIAKQKAKRLLEQEEELFE